MGVSCVTIGDRCIGPGQPCYVVAEAGVNHNGNLAIGHALIDAASAAGADAVKFQCFFTESLISPTTGKAPYQKQRDDDRETQFEMLKSLELSEPQLTALNRHCGDIGIQFLCTPYDIRSVAILERIGVSAYKVASTDTNNISFLRHLAGRQRPILLSTGMSAMDEIAHSLAAIATTGNTALALLHCTSQYPTPLPDLNLKAIGTLGKRFGLPVGFSDHSMGIDAVPWAVAAGACIIEKHFTMDRTMAGPDHRASIEPEALGLLVQRIRQVETALGDGVKCVLAGEIENKRILQKSVVAAGDIPAGATIGENDLTTRRPGWGLSPQWIDRLVGGVAITAIGRGEMIALETVAIKETP